MKRLKIKSLFKFTFLLVINCFVQNSIIAILSILYLLLTDCRSLLIYLFLFACITFFNNKEDFVSYGIVCEQNGNMLLVEKGLYQVRTYNDKNYEIGDVIHYENGDSNSTSSYYIRQNILFKTSDKHHKEFNIKTYSFICNALDKLDETTKQYVKQLLFHSNVNNDDISIEYLGYGFCFYYLLLFMQRRNRIISYLILALYILFFGFDIKFYLFIFDAILYKNKTSDLNKLLIKVIFILLLNKFLLLNYSIVLTFLFNLIFMSEYKSSKVIIAILQSILFGEIKIFSSFFYKQYFLYRICLFFLSLLVLFVPLFSKIYLIFMALFSKVASIIHFSIRGKISILILVIYCILCKILKLKDRNVRYALICFLMVLPLNNPFHHITFVNVGQGDATLIHGTFNQYNILIDTGPSFNYGNLRRTLISEGVYEIDYLIISHMDEDHSGNISKLQNDFNIKNILYEGEDIHLSDCDLNYLYIGNFDNDNDNSNVYLYCKNGFKVLFTGDISSNVENMLIFNKNLKEIDVLKVSHHGSNTATSNYFVGSISPKVAIISTSGQYNHPSEEVMNVLESYFVDTYITKQKGNITIYVNKLFQLLQTEYREFVII